jgi:hypothetical protein
VAVPCDRLEQGVRQGEVRLPRDVSLEARAVVVVAQKREERLPCVETRATARVMPRCAWELRQRLHDEGLGAVRNS